MSRLETALTDAREAWKDTEPMGARLRLLKAKELDGYGVFSVSMLSKICRVSEPLARKEKLGRRVQGGRFAPEALSALIILQRNRTIGKVINKSMVQVTVDAGCSLFVVSRLTGIPYTTLYRLMED